MANSSHVNLVPLCFYVIEDAVFSYSQFPKRRFKFETGFHGFQFLAVSRRRLGLISKLCLNGPDALGLVGFSNSGQFFIRGTIYHDFKRHAFTPRSPPNSRRAASAPRRRTPSAARGTPPCRTH